MKTIQEMKDLKEDAKNQIESIISDLQDELKGFEVKVSIYRSADVRWDGLKSYTCDIEVLL